MWHFQGIWDGRPWNQGLPYTFPHMSAFSRSLPTPHTSKVIKYVKYIVATRSTLVQSQVCSTFNSKFLHPPSRLHTPLKFKLTPAFRCLPGPNITFSNFFAGACSMCTIDSIYEKYKNILRTCLYEDKI